MSHVSEVLANVPSQQLSPAPVPPPCQPCCLGTACACPASSRRSLFHRNLGGCTHHVPFAFISRLAQVLARLGELVRVMLETFRWQSPVFLNAVRRDETRFQCIEQRRARRGHGCEKKSVLTAVASTPPCLSPRSCARHRAWPPSPVAPCSPSPAATRPNSSTACSQTTSRATRPTARSCTPRCDLVQLAPGPD